MDVQIPPVFYKTSSSFGAEALLTSKATIDKSLLQAWQSGHDKVREPANQIRRHGLDFVGRKRDGGKKKGKEKNRGRNRRKKI